jgi:hypothetical protein
MGVCPSGFSRQKDVEKAAWNYKDEDSDHLDYPDKKSGAPTYEMA